MSDLAKEAQRILVSAGLKSDFATKVVAECGCSPDEIIKDPITALGDYWYGNMKVDFLDDDVAVNATEFRKGLTAIQLQESVVDQVCSLSIHPHSLGHRDIFDWGLMIVRGRLSN